jgi:4'-phosphopantetheinyl transferase
LAAFAKTLSDHERKRAERFQFDRDRDRFIIRRGLLRRMLGHYLHTDPAQVAFTCQSRGKPVLAGITDGQTLHFNLSHSHGLALFAVARESALGIDLERIRPIPEIDQIAARFFSPYENALLDDLPKEQIPEAFFHCWTRKEAYLKATGEGIADSLPEVEVSLSPGRAAQVVSIAGDLQEAALWTIHALAPAPGFVGALAVKAKDFEALCCRWPSGEGDSVSLEVPEEIRMG